MKNNSIQNIENYNNILDETEKSVFIRYVGLMNEYLTLCGENIYMQNNTYLKFVMKRGLETLSHIFNIMLLFTCNLDLTFYHCQKAFYYYVEFIGQIGDDNHTFLQLNSKDASLFVYKKTIFDLNNEYRKDFVENVDTENKFTSIKLLINMYNKLLVDAINSNEFPDANNAGLLKKINEPVYRIVENIVQTTSKDTNELMHKLTLIDYFVNSLSIKKDTNDTLTEKYLNYIDIFTRKNKKKKLSFDMLKLKLHSAEFEQRIEQDTILKVVNWLCNTTAPEG